MTSIRSTAARRWLAGAAAALLACAAQAQAWPTKPITLVVPFPPGGFTDNVTRVVAQDLSTALGQPVIVENKSGAGGRLGTDAILRAPKDGYTIGLAVPATLSLLPVTDPRYASLNSQITPLTLAVRADMALAINPAHTAARNFKDFVAQAKAQKGKIAYASAGLGTSWHLWTETISEAIGVDAVHVPYKGEAPAMTDLMGGQVQYMLVTGSAKPHVDAGKLLVLATTGRERWGVYPDAPTLKELGVDVVASGWLAYIAPAGIPKDVADKLNQAFAKALRAPAVTQALGLQGYRVVASSPDELAATVKSEVALFDKIIKSGRVKLE